MGAQNNVVAQGALQQCKPAAHNASCTIAHALRSMACTSRAGRGRRLGQLLGNLLPDVATALVEGHFHSRKLVQHCAEVLRPVLLPALHLLQKYNCERPSSF